MTTKEKLKILDLLKSKILVCGDSCGGWFVIDNVNMTKKEEQQIKEWLRD